MKRLMMEDLPTAWSPRKTILYFRRGGIVPFERFKLLMFVILSKLIALFQIAHLSQLKCLSAPGL